MSEVSVLNNMMQPVTKISPDGAILVNLKFTYALAEGETFSNIKVDATDIYPNGLYAGADYSALTPTCVESGGTYTCMVSSLTMKTSKNPLGITVKGTLKIEEPSSTTNFENTTAITLIIDNTKPTLSFIGTETCMNGICYIPSGKRARIKIEMQDDDATFVKGHIAFKVGADDAVVDSCEGMTCHGSTKITCEDGQIVAAKIRHNPPLYSRDDLGNKVELKSFNLTCDAADPTINNFKISSILGTDTLTLDNEIIFEINATEITSPLLSMTIDADSIAAGNITSDCTKIAIEGTSFQCRAAIRPLVEEPGDYKIGITVKDLAGRIKNTSVTIKVLKTTNETINLWNVGSVTQSSTSFSRSNMMFERTIFAEVPLSSIYDVDIVEIKPEGKCYAIEPNETGQDSDVVSVKTVSVQQEKIYLKIAIRENGDARYDSVDVLKFYCPLTISSQKGKYYYSNPEKDNFTIEIDLKDEENVQQMHDREINKTMESIEKTMNWLNDIDKGVNTVKSICEICGVVDTVDTGLGAVEALVSLIPGIGDGVGGGLATVTNSLDIITKEETGICSKMEKMCGPFTCDQKYLDAATDSANNMFGKANTESVNNVLNYAGYEDISSTMNPYKSYIVAVSTMCLPAVTYHFKVYEGIQCNYLDCISRQYVNFGQDIYACQDARAMSECAFWYGGLLDGLPLVSMVRDMAEKVGNIAKDPGSLIGLAVPLACKALVGTPKIHGPCVAVSDLISSTAVVGMVKDIFEQMDFANSKDDPAGNCAEVVEYAKLPPKDKIQWGHTEEDTFTFSSERILDTGTLKCGASDCIYHDTAANKDYRLIVADNSQDGGAAQEIMVYEGTRLVGYTLDANVPILPTGDETVATNVLDNKEVVDATLMISDVRNDELENQFPDISEYIKNVQDTQYDLERALYIGDSAPIDEQNAKIYDEMAEIAGQTDITPEDVERLGTLVSQLPPSEENVEYAEYVRQLAQEAAPGSDEYYTAAIGLKDKAAADATDAQAAADSKNTNIAEAEAANRQAIDSAEWSERFGTTKRAMMTGWSNVNAIQSFRQVTNFNWGVVGESTALGRLSETLLVDVAQYELGYCRKKLDVDRGLGEDVVILNSVGPDSYRSGAQVSGRRAGPVDAPDQNDYYEYWIRGNVVSYKGSGLIVRVIMVEPNGNEVDITGTNAGLGDETSSVINAGTPLTFGINYFTDEKEYSKVCLKFGAGNLHEYFDYVQGNPDRICQTLESED
ncbi:MAG: hypothetical protein ACP5N3_03755 [Candidatus Nanoarchaeia archaeon]